MAVLPKIATQQPQGYVKVAFLSLTILLAALLEGLQWVLWRRFAPPEHPLQSLEERSEEDGEGQECNFYIALPDRMMPSTSRPDSGIM